MLLRPPFRFARGFFGATADDEINSLPGIQIQRQQFLLRRLMRRAPMRGQHAEQGALPVVERRGLHASISGGGGGLAVWLVEFVSFYVFYHHARSAANGSATGSIVIRVDNAEGFDERLVESAQRGKLENLPLGVIKLNVAEVSPHQAYGRLENFFQRGI